MIAIGLDQDQFALVGVGLTSILLLLRDTDEVKWCCKLQRETFNLINHEICSYSILYKELNAWLGFKDCAARFV